MVMLVFGMVIILILTFVPYSLTLLSHAGDHVVAAIVPADDGEALREMERMKPLVPSFDVEGWYARRGEETALHGVLIESLDGQKLYGSHNADQTFNPASLIKLATSLVALKQLGPDYCFETKVYIDGALDEDGTLRGRIHVAGGDPTFGDIAGAMIARELRQRGIEKVDENLTVSRDFCFNFSASPDESAARLMRLINPNQKKTTKKPGRNKEVVRAIEKKKSEPATPQTEERHETAPPEETFQRVAAEPPGQPFFVLRSYPLREVLLYMNAHSSNFVAERLGALCGGAAALERFLVNELQLPPEQVKITTTSGREHNRLTARGVIAILRALHAEAQRQGLKLADIMPVTSDDSGTLRRRLAGTPLAGAMVGKTGTLTAEVDGGMASLAGVIYTEKAGQILFVILDQGRRIWENRQLEDQLLNEIIISHDTPINMSNQSQRRLLPPTSLSIQWP